ncbi:hypothetical protein GJ496_005263 [Pomphorhynchus laevis]|nr:hypothetical protein GJ496_005263 [Pomphorhynchus laevis]
MWIATGIISVQLSNIPRKSSTLSISEQRKRAINSVASCDENAVCEDDRKFYQSEILSIGDSINRRSYQSEILSIGDPINRRFYQSEILSIGDPINRRFYHSEILSIGDSINQRFYQSEILSIGDSINLRFYQLEILSIGDSINVEMFEDYINRFAAGCCEDVNNVPSLNDEETQRAIRDLLSIGKRLDMM